MAACLRSMQKQEAGAGSGDEGAVNLRAGVADKYPNGPYHMGSPGTIFRNLIITGAQGKKDDPSRPTRTRRPPTANPVRRSIPHSSEGG